MGEHDVSDQLDQDRLRGFMKALLADVQALERMLDSDRIESGSRVGAEQEMFLIDATGRPARKALEILGKIEDPRFVTELALFNLEANASPRKFDGTCLSDMEAELTHLVTEADRVATELGCRVLLCGILPSLKLTDLGLDAMTPSPRYAALNQTITKMRGGSFPFRIKGLDELDIVHDNVMVEAANTSFQIHLQVGPKDFARLYNLAQAIAGPVLAPAVNSPLLLGKRLWQETRVAVFQQSIDARSVGQQTRGHRPRVDFGERWVEHSVLEIFKEDIARFRVVLAQGVDEKPLEVLAGGGIPKLMALRLHNGTVYRWNRPCYGVNEGTAHLRIEMRALPAGPSIRDQMANAAFFFGLMSALGDEIGDVSKVMPFDDAKNNFFAAARHGLFAQMTWPGVGLVPAPILILEHLLPRARAGLKASGVVAADADLYLDVLEERVRTGKTGAHWAVTSLQDMGSQGTKDQRLCALALGYKARQGQGLPVAQWTQATLTDGSHWAHSYRSVGQFMTTDLFTVRPYDLVDLAASLMDWEKIRHIPVEDDDGRLVGIVTHRSLLRMVARSLGSPGGDPVAVAMIMKPNPVSIPSDTSTLDAIRLMRLHKVGCLPVVDHGKLVGIVTERDFMGVAGGLLEQQLMQS